MWRINISHHNGSICHRTPFVIFLKIVFVVQLFQLPTHISLRLFSFAYLIYSLIRIVTLYGHTSMIELYNSPFTKYNFNLFASRPNSQIVNINHSVVWIPHKVYVFSPFFCLQNNARFGSERLCLRPGIPVLNSHQIWRHRYRKLGLVSTEHQSVSDSNCYHVTPLVKSINQAINTVAPLGVQRLSSTFYSSSPQSRCVPNHRVLMLFEWVVFPLCFQLLTFYLCQQGFVFMSMVRMVGHCCLFV